VAPLPIITDTYRVALNYTNTVNGLIAANVMHFKKSGGTSADLATKLNSHATNTMFELLPTTCSVTSIVITPLDGSSASYPYTPATPANWTGHGGAGDFSPQVAAIVKLLTGKRGRSYRGRVYLPWIAEAQSGGGGLNGTSKNTTTSAWTAFLAAMLGDGWQMVVASYKLETSEAVLTTTCEGFTATQRRRNARNSTV